MIPAEVNKSSEKTKNDNFIMLPTVDFCFKELMKNPKVRKGFIAAVLEKQPEEIANTILISTELRKESEMTSLVFLTCWSNWKMERK